MVARSPDAYLQACATCGTEFRVLPCHVRRNARKGGGPPQYCSNRCRGEALRGASNPRWQGGRYLSSGYVMRYAPDHPHAHDAHVLEHRLVMERHLGRYLDPAENVHHINHDRQDNRIENLELCASGSEHRIRHGEWEHHPCAMCGTPVRRSAFHRRRFARAFCSRTCGALYASEVAAANAAARRAAR